MTDAIPDTSSRREVLAASLLGALPLLLAGSATASPLDPAQTIIQPPDELKWIPTKGYPEGASDRCVLAGDMNGSGLYYTLVRWWPGYMSAPHHYTTDRFCMVVSGTWWCNSGADFDPASCVPVKAGSYVHRVAGTPHYDGVVAQGTEPAVIAICGIAPINYALVDASKPGWRKV
ncbi:hypothetical protein [Methylobacterium brachythecii]|uniref:Uncharacterized protein n=1 Tax=Methylobacterium brachythecii TaxID=1176177 RepID=A0A7W6F520_9HYPH|nr:hypothetical protein [Methylobacterium brachythecii]MBB3900965.1 hypothetical protein [Methylobacterium brachythecii]GLS45266.1 hypothetical protein GCM10007884_32550 [Methylobacterium brachythecii]